MNYSHRSVVDKLGVKPGHAVALVGEAWELPAELVGSVLVRAERGPAEDGEPADVVLVAVDSASDVVEVLRHWREKIARNGGIWLLSPKRGRRGYLEGEVLIAAGKDAGVVDNKICSVNEEIGAMRFVIRKEDR